MVYLVRIIEGFLPLALISGLVLSLWKAAGTRSWSLAGHDENRTAANNLPLSSTRIDPLTAKGNWMSALSNGVAAGLGSGAVLYLAGQSHTFAVEVRTALDILAASGILLVAAAAWFSPRNNLPARGVLGFSFFSLAARAMFAFIVSVADYKLSSTAVFNSELIFNSTAILSGAGIIGLVAAVSAHMGVVSGRAVGRWLLAACALLLASQWMADALLGLMRLEMVGVTTGLLSLVARMEEISQLFPYVMIAFLGLLAAVFSIRRDHIIPIMNNRLRIGSGDSILPHRVVQGLPTLPSTCSAGSPDQEKGNSYTIKLAPSPQPSPRRSVGEVIDSQIIPLPPCSDERIRACPVLDTGVRGQKGNSHACKLKNSERRKAVKRALLESRWLKAAALALILTVSPLLYYYLYASRAPRISTPVRIKANAEGEITIPFEELRDGKLHRYAYITEEGKVVRFFLINKYKDRMKIGVVYDACPICGDRGFIQKGNEVICLACNVRIFIPSIGKAGGCNPIPLEHELRDEAVIINRQELSQGARYFSEVVSLKEVEL